MPVTKRVIRSIHGSTVQIGDAEMPVEGQPEPVKMKVLVFMDPESGDVYEVPIPVDVAKQIGMALAGVGGIVPATPGDVQQMRRNGTEQ